MHTLKPIVCNTAIYSCFLLLILISCKSEENLGLDKYYPYRSITALEIQEVAKTDYFIGIDDINIPLNVMAYNATGEIVEVAPDAIRFIANDTVLEESNFSVKEEGVYNIIAQLGEKTSDTLIIRILDPAKLSLHLSVDAAQQAAFTADGKSSLDFDVKLLHNGTAVAISSQFVLYCNNQVININTPFTTRSAGELKFKAKGANLESNQIAVEALSPVKKLMLSKDKSDPHFFGYNISEVGFVLEGLDANNQPVALSDDIKLFNGTKEIDRAFRFKTNDLGRQIFHAKGYKLESNQLELDVKSPVKTLKLSYKNSGNTFWADGVSAITFSLEAFDFNDKAITAAADVKLYQGSSVVDYKNPFSTTQTGELKFRAKGYNSESNEITVTAISAGNFKVVRIPVVFHEVNKTALTQASINDLVEGVSKVFRNKWNHTGGPKDPNSSDVFIEIYAAERDPDGNMLAVKGLNRVKSQKESFNVNNAQQINEAGNDAWNYYWNPDQYLNIWVYPNVTGDFKGYSWAYFPVVAKPLEGVGYTTDRTVRPYFNYGVFLNADHVGNVPLLAHEIGHMLALSHVFDGNLGASKECSNQDPDYCPDTPYYNRNNYLNGVNANYDNRLNRLSCAGDAYVSTNVMDYYYTHENSFTFDQRTRARHVVEYGLWLPTEFNGFSGGRRNNVSGYMKRPAKYIYVQPVSCGVAGN